MTSSTEAAASAPAPAAAPSPTATVVDGELKTAAEVVFEVRPLSGPGTMGPTALSTKSDPSLEEVRAYLTAHPDAGPLRIECAINPERMSSSPDAKWPASLALQIANWLVERGIDCKRLEAAGRLDSELNGQERVRFFVNRDGRDRPPNRVARLSVCPALR